MLTSRQIELFWVKVKKTETCWLWTASVGWNGYGMFGRPTRRAHVVALELAGVILQPGQQGLHKCNITRCVRVHPEHVYPGTHADNMQDRKATGFKPRVPWVPGESNGASKLTKKQVHEILHRYQEGKIGRVRRSSVTLQMLADEYEVSYTQVKRIIHRQAWRHL
jgi:hypothetical protein